MCGITGFIDFSQTTGKPILEKMTNTLIHRGPDGGNSILFSLQNASIGLGHRRLSIIELSELGAQPMIYKHFKITYNGEIYNYKEIKLELEELGHQFLSHSDTEVLLHAYEEWQEAFLHKLIGMFAFAIVDEKKGEVLFARDRAGVKPLFYYSTTNFFLFSSELKAFHEHPNFSKQLNHDAIALYMQYGNIPAPYTIFKDCFKINPGHFIKLNLKNKEITETEYWNVYEKGYNQPKLKLSFDEAKEKTEAILNSAFNYRMVSDVPVGVFLSGGYDSAGLTSILQKNSTKKIQTFTIGVSDFGLDESKYAKEISKHLGTEHHELICTEKDALDIIIQLPYYYDEPFADSSAIPTTLVCKMAKKEVTVVLSADGGDEVFAGYNRYDYLMKYGKLLNKTPKSIRHASLFVLNQVSSKKIPILKNRYNFHNRYNKLKNLLSDPSAENMMNSLSKQFLEPDLKKLLTLNYEELKTNYSNKKLKSEFYSPLSYMMAIDYQTYLPDDILQKVDRASMTSSIEAREPFLDHRLIEWAAKLPDEFKYRDGVKKYMLKEIVHQYIPKKMMDRPKMGFAIPIEKWLYTELKPMVLNYLDESVIAQQGIFDVAMVNNIKKEYYQGKIENSSKLWYLLMFQMWYEKWMS